MEAFGRFDKKGIGRLTLNEMGPALRRLGQNPTDNELQELMQEFDTHNDKTIHFPEFVVSTGNFYRFQYTK